MQNLLTHAMYGVPGAQIICPKRKRLHVRDQGALLLGRGRIEQCPDARAHGRVTLLESLAMVAAQRKQQASHVWLVPAQVLRNGMQHLPPALCVWLKQPQPLLVQLCACTTMAIRAAA